MNKPIHALRPRTLAVAAALALGLSGLGLAPATARAADPAACRTVHISDIGWTDNQVTNALFSTTLDALGYKADIKTLSEEVTYAGIKAKKIDVFLDDWTPSMDAITGPYVKSKAMQQIGPNMTGAKYTLVVPTYLYDQGLKTFADIAKFGKQLHYKIYGIEPGNDGNVHILKMIKTNAFGLKHFKLVQSSEQGMLAEVARLYPQKKDIVFLGWEPHPMNVNFQLSYLAGGHKYFGPKEGAAAIYTNVRYGYVQACPNVGKLLTNLHFTVQAESAMMNDILNKKMDASVVAKNWMKAHPAVVKSWLSGVTTLGGKPGLPAVTKAISG